eukprot:TRINITY_DN13334_c0_g1_i1.p1 TRINITY_DN13334_c0_g1~~TRINITY_DN13334_c0_g1_i1.p1  ORF type:complete len:430 (+),score=37.17 TRINITY_DN13334_c0_g1_i1:34-1290(+)
MSNEVVTFLSIPSEVLSSITSSLDWQSKLQLRATCVATRQLCSIDDLFAYDIESYKRKVRRKQEQLAGNARLMKEKWQEARDLLSNTKRDALDREFTDLVYSFFRNGWRHFEEVKQLTPAIRDFHKKGGKLWFDDHELGFNLAHFFENFKHFSEPMLLFDLCELMIGSSDCWATNKCYIGNGGQPIILEFFNELCASQAEPKKLKFFWKIVQLMLAISEAQLLPFPELYNFRNPENPTTLKYREKALKLAILAGTPLSDEYYEYPRLDFVHTVSTSIFALIMHCEPRIFGSIPVTDFLNSKGSKASCRLFFYAFRLFPQPQPARQKLLFDMVAKRQRKFIECALTFGNPEDRIHEWRDERGNTVLHKLCGTRGLIHKIGMLLLQAGCDPHSLNNNGETPIDLARRIRQKRMVQILQSL